MTSDAVLALRRVRRRLDPPQRNANAEWRERLSLELVLDLGDGAPGRGEAAPLPDYSPDDVSQVERTLQALPPGKLEALAHTSGVRALLDAVAASIPPDQPSARFALETALLDRAAQRAGQPLWQLLAPLLHEPSGALASAAGAEDHVYPALPRSQPVPLSAILPNGAPGPSLLLARRHLADGVTSFKLKIGPERISPEQEATFARLRSELGPRVQLRADANGSLSPRGLGPTLEKLAAHELEYLEEPLAGAEPELFTGCPCPLALDESLQRLEPGLLERWLALPALRVLVLKPTALGGAGACIRLARAARERGRDVVVSHTLEGPIGWAACAHLALALGGARAAGLWPLPHQAAARPAISDGCILPASEPGLGASG